MPRLFFALEIPAPIKANLLRVRAPVDGGKWQTSDQLHLTLLFLGSVPEEALPDISEALRDLPLARFQLAVHGVGCFGQPESPRNLWAGVGPEAPVATLNAFLKERLGHMGFHFDKRPFRPHITLARFKKYRGSVTALLAEHGQDEFGSFPVGAFVLIESTQGAPGSVYTVAERFRLRDSLDETADPCQR